MTFTPTIPLGGLIGWNLLSKTIDQQKSTFSDSGLINREIRYFEENFSKVQTVDDLVSDRSLLKVALGAFGLQEDLDNRFFIKKIISEGTENRTSLANLLADTRYKDLANSFDFTDSTLKSSEFVKKVVQDYVDQAFELEVGAQNENFRLALNLERTLEDIGQGTASNDTKWFTIMGNPPLRKVFEVALNLPTSFGTLPIDNQLNEFKKRSASALGTSEVANLSEASLLVKITQRFLLQSQIGELSTVTPQSTALQLLTASSL